MNKFGNLAIFAGLAFAGLQASLYSVDPGERALIMDNFTGLKQKVYGQGYHLLVPFIQVNII
jgi:regulator of protease activity HflC (stomatin/prohibitin superfamily)